MDFSNHTDGPLTKPLKPYSAARCFHSLPVVTSLLPLPRLPLRKKSRLLLEVWKGLVLMLALLMMSWTNSIPLRGIRIGPNSVWKPRS